LAVLNASEQAYAESVEALRMGPYVDFPLVVGIETLSLCNAACDFGPDPTLERKGEVMPDSLIEKIFADLEAVNNRPPFRFNLARVNEPFLDPRIFELSEEINRRFPEAEHVFFSNSTPLNEANLLRLSKVRNVCYLNLSVNDHRPQQYERTMRLPWARTTERLDLIHRMKSQAVLTFPVVLSRVGDGSEADSEFLEWVRRTYPLFQGAVSTRGDWMGAIPTLLSLVPDVACTQWFKLHFLSDGRSPFCCMDSDAKWGVGNVSCDHAIHAIYNHVDRRRLRLEVNSRLQVDTCRPCPQLV
jgi:hypothetical protein